MTRTEFARVMTFITAAIGKPLAVESLEVYYELLGDLPLDALQASAKRVVLEHKWATFPSVAELREAASETMRGQVKELSSAEAWDMAWRAACSIDLDMVGPYQSGDKLYSSQAEYMLEAIQPLVLEVMHAYSLPALCYGKEPVGVIRGQFMRIFEQLAARDRRTALLPASLVNDIGRIGCREKKLAVSAETERIGVIDG